jgi:hypothetical protein
VNGFLVLKDKQKFEKGSETVNESFISILNGNAHYTVNGNSALQANKQYSGLWRNTTI